MSKKKFINFLTPKGITKFSYLVKPDDGEKIDADPSWKTTLLLDPEAEGVQEFLQFLDAQLEEAAAHFHSEKPATKKYSLTSPYSDELDKDGEETGMIAINVKKKTQSKDGTALKAPALFDAKGKRCYPDAVFGGSQVIIAGHLFPYAMGSTKSIGLSLKLDGVQIIELVEASGATAEQLGFTAQDGYEGDTFENAGSDDGGEEEDGNDDF
jgi:hypothetical protein